MRRGGALVDVDDGSLNLIARADFHRIPLLKIANRSPPTSITGYTDGDRLHARRYVAIDDPRRVKTMAQASMVIVAVAAFASFFGQPTRAGQTNVAVAANFTEPAKEIAALFRQETGYDAILSFGASGPVFTQ